MHIFSPHVLGKLTLQDLKICLLDAEYQISQLREAINKLEEPKIKRKNNYPKFRITKPAPVTAYRTIIESLTNSDNYPLTEIGKTLKIGSGHFGFRRIEESRMTLYVISGKFRGFYARFGKRAVERVIHNLIDFKLGYKPSIADNYSKSVQQMGLGRIRCYQFDWEALLKRYPRT